MQFREGGRAVDWATPCGIEAGAHDCGCTPPATVDSALGGARHLHVSRLCAGGESVATIG